MPVCVRVPGLPFTGRKPSFVRFAFPSARSEIQASPRVFRALTSGWSPIKALHISGTRTFVE